jgi:hypothetical protein
VPAPEFVTNDGSAGLRAVGSAVVVLLEFDHPGTALSDLAVAHDEHLALDMCISPPAALRRAGGLRHDDVALLDHAHDLQLERVDEYGSAAIVGAAKVDHALGLAAAAGRFAEHDLGSILDHLGYAGDPADVVRAD